MTPKEKVIRSEQKAKELAWTRARVNKLAAAFELTMGELAAMCNMTEYSFMIHYNKNRFRGPLAVVLEGLWQAWMERLGDRTADKTFESLSQQKDSTLPNLPAEL